MEQLKQDILKQFPQYTLCPFEELALYMPKDEKDVFKRKYAGTIAVVGCDLCSRHERYEVHAFIQKSAREPVFTMAFATGEDVDSRKCRCCKEYLECVGQGAFFQDIYTCQTCAHGECFGSEYGRPDSCDKGSRPYFPRLKNVVLFAFHDFRPRKQVLRQRKQIKRRLPEILLQIHSEKTTHLSWLPKDLIKLIASF
jgi:hypothetical protein